MKKNVNFTDFCDAFNAMGRGDQFSYNGKKALFGYLCEVEEDTGDEIELDVIALCCEYAEYENIKEFQRDYGDKYKALNDIADKTTVIEINDESFIIVAF